MINFYGPQEPQNDQDKTLVRNFWLELEKEIISAKSKNCPLVLQGDANAKLGNQLFPRDLHEQSFNGSILSELVSKHNLFILNLSDKCDGLITRQRNTIKGIELSIIDFIIVDEALMNSFENMTVDDKRLHVLTKYSTKKGFKTKIISDHNLLHAKFNIKYKKKRDF